MRQARVIVAQLIRLYAHVPHADFSSTSPFLKQLQVGLIPESNLGIDAEVLFFAARMTFPRSAISVKALKDDGVQLVGCKLMGRHVARRT